MSFIVSGVRAAINSTSFGKKTEMYLTRPRNAHMSEADFGTGQFNILSTFNEFTSMPQPEMWWPRKSTSVQKNSDFFPFNHSPCFLKQSITIWT
jgi:hypothetical protein